MKPNRLLSELIALPYDARFRRLVELGRESRSNLKVASILDAWKEGDWQERLFCAQSCAGSGNVDHLLRLIQDPSRTVSGLAMRLMVVHARRKRLIAFRSDPAPEVAMRAQFHFETELDGV